MLLKSMLKWQFITLALFVAGTFCLASPGWAGLLVSRSGDTGGNQLSRLELEKEILASSLEKLGWSREDLDTRLAQLSGKEIHRLSTAMEKVMAGGEEEADSNPLGVGIVIALILLGITGLYLFSQ
ncbi:MAG TPA: hypothetical protein ENH12_03435 [Proteobacteria bacterium]|nr:hypothetical protein [Pseudomonadota bacterium]